MRKHVLSSLCAVLVAALCGTAQAGHYVRSNSVDIYPAETVNISAPSSTETSNSQKEVTKNWLWVADGPGDLPPSTVTFVVEGFWNLCEMRASVNPGYSYVKAYAMVKFRAEGAEVYGASTFAPNNLVSSPGTFLFQYFDAPGGNTPSRRATWWAGTQCGATNGSASASGTSINLTSLTCNGVD